MTSERAFVVGLEPDAEVTRLLDDMQSAATRARKADAGDRADVLRFEALATQLEHVAARVSDVRVEVPVTKAERALFLGTEESTWTNVEGEVEAAARAIISHGRVPVVLLEAFEPGATSGAASVQGPPPPATRWPGVEGLTGRRAVEARFRCQLQEAVAAGRQTTEPRPIFPSGVQNAIVTEILRDFVQVVAGDERVDVPVEYRDGSRSKHPFALRSLGPSSGFSADAAMDLHFALLSIRHAEMDAVIHGAWLRNAQVSRPRPAGQTDDFVYVASREQLYELTARGTRQVHIHMYQTGLETAVVGFYKALVDHLLELPGTVAVQPMYFREERTRHRGYKKKVRSSVITRQARFVKGTPWQM